ncbi:MAG: hypothetical protein ACOH1Y_04320 [Propionicimonas sp.]
MGAAFLDDLDAVLLVLFPVLITRIVGPFPGLVTVLILVTLALGRSTSMTMGWAFSSRSRAAALSCSP